MSGPIGLCACAVKVARAKGEAADEGGDKDAYVKGIRESRSDAEVQLHPSSTHGGMNCTWAQSYFLFGSLPTL